MPEASETRHFEAETKQILELVIHSLYSDRHIFLRELLSNASDALDRMRYESLQRDDLRPTEAEPGITIAVDEEAGTLTVSDNGIGMTRTEVIDNLGTIARSGTRAFVEAARQGDVEGLIGQFGVGFYSAFMVADRVEVHTLSADPQAEPVCWQAESGDIYTVETGSREHRGTDVVLHLREDAREFLEEARIREVVRQHSDFLSYPVVLGEDRLNQATALWARMASEITDEEYEEFYKHVSGDWEPPLVRLHISADAPLQYHALLFVPTRRPFDLDSPEARVGVRLYCKRVLILEEARELFPRYLRFVRGVVESDDLDLNLSRQMLQQTPVARKLRKQLTGRLLKRLGEVARKDPDTYRKFWETFGATLKEGIHEDEAHRDRIEPLLRFHTTRDEGLRSLQQVVDDMPPEQDAIWYLTGLDRDRMAESPLLEGFRRKGWEVLLMSDPVDEWVVMNLHEYADKPLKSVARGTIDEDEPEEDDPIAREARKKTGPLLEYLGELFEGEVAEVRASSRLTESPSVLVDSEQGLGANMERILQVARKDIPMTPRVLEVNVEHPIVRNLSRLHEQGRTATLEPMARLLLDHARLAEGQVADPSSMVERLQRVLLQASASLSGGEGGGARDEQPVPEPDTGEPETPSPDDAPTEE